MRVVLCIQFLRKESLSIVDDDDDTDGNGTVRQCPPLSIDPYIGRHTHYKTLSEKDDSVDVHDDDDDDDGGGGDDRVILIKLPHRYEYFHLHK